MLEYRLLSSVLCDGYGKEDEEGIAIANKDRMGKKSNIRLGSLRERGEEGGIVGRSIQYCFIAGSWVDTGGIHSWPRVSSRSKKSRNREQTKSAEVEEESI